MLSSPLPALNDPEGERVPASLPFIADAHVHLFPDNLFRAIWQWFEQFGWPIRYQLKAPDALDFLFSRGIGHVVALQYAHKPGVARSLNAYMAGLCRLYPEITGMATVFPGEKDAAGILTDAFDMGLGGVKLHAHVQCFDMEGPEIREVCEACEACEKPLVVHAGREPRSPAYDCDSHLICSADRLEHMIRDYPGLKVCVPHLGADEFGAYQGMLEQYDNLWLDTTMALAGYLPGDGPPPLTSMRLDRIMYGTDFPNIPYAWDRELKRLCDMGLSDDSLALVLGRNAIDFFSISPN